MIEQVRLPQVGTGAAFKRAARRLAVHGIRPEAVVWSRGGGEGDLFAAAPQAMEDGPPGAALRVPRAAASVIETALHHSDPERFARAYAALIALSEGDLTWSDRADPRVGRLEAMAKSVRRDIHKTHAFVRFRELESGRPRRRFAAWFEPEHLSLEASAPFFAKRFGDMDWAICTPDLTARFEDGGLRFAPTDAALRPPADETEALWAAYYASIFNPARVKTAAMRAEMPKKYWKNLPEAALIPALVRGAETRVREMAAQEADSAFARAAAGQSRRQQARLSPPPATDLEALAREAAACDRCPLHECATRTVFGEGPPDADLMIVGEQPGDAEDLAGRPFVGPAGAEFDAALNAAGIERSRAYVTNAVKHFKFVPRGKRRIHQKPEPAEIRACRPWLEAERAQVRPRLIVAMGASACASLTGSGQGVMKRRGEIETDETGTPVLVTIHPSYILRLPDVAERADERARFAGDLRAAKAFVDHS